MKVRLPVVAAPLEEEIAPFVARLDAAAERRGADLVTYQGRLHDLPVVAAVIGDGAGASERGLSRLLMQVEPERLLLMGVAGGLSDDLGVGALIQAAEVRSEGDGVRRGRRADLEVPSGTVATAERIVSTRDAKRALWEALGRPRRCVVDVESYGVVERMEHLGVPWTVVRAVIDPSEEDLPLDFGALSDAEGQVVRSRVLWYLLRKPVAMKGVLELRSRVRSCAASLATVAEKWLAR